MSPSSFFYIVVRVSLLSLAELGYFRLDRSLGSFLIGGSCSTEGSLKAMSFSTGVVDVRVVKGGKVELTFEAYTDSTIYSYRQ